MDGWYPGGRSISIRPDIRWISSFSQIWVIVRELRVLENFAHREGYPWIICHPIAKLWQCAKYIHMIWVRRISVVLESADTRSYFFRQCTAWSATTRYMGRRPTHTTRCAKPAAPVAVRAPSSVEAAPFSVSAVILEARWGKKFERKNEII